MERIPKNIRQIGGREERLKMYMEDYVNTYLRKLQEDWEESGAAGMLVGQWQETEAGPAVFINGAVQLGAADLDKGQVVMNESAWDEVYGALGTYFSGQELCGLFVCEGICRRFRRQALFSAVRENFPDSPQTILYILSEEGEEIVYRITEKREERLQGYLCYFERNEAMQEYMMDHLRRRQVEKEELPGRRSSLHESGRSGGEASEEPERVVRGKEGSLGSADVTESFREHLRREQEEKKRRAGGRSVFGLCAAMAVVVFACGLLLMQKKNGGTQIQDILDELRIHAGGFLEVSGRPEETSSVAASRPVTVEEVPGNVYPTAGDEEAAGSNAAGDSVAESTTAAAETTTAAAESTTAAVESTTAVVESTTAAAETAAAGETAASTGVTYTVQAGDSLYSISRRFYGTEAMVSKIQELNQLTNADLIKEGQTLLLP